MYWRAKALIQRLLSNTPGGDIIYYFGQRYLGGFRHFNINDKISQGEAILNCLFNLKAPLVDKSSVEIGTGWAPIMPLLFWLCGLKECHTYDISRLLRYHLLVESIKQLRILARKKDSPFVCGETGTNILDERLGVLPDLISRKLSSDEILQHCNIHYHAPTDAANSGLPDKSIDLAYSVTVLEHIPLININNIFAEARRILRPNGLMVHFIDTSDHFSHADNSISSINFLRFSEKSFSKYNTRFTFQNRIRASAWRRLITEHGFEIIYWKGDIDKKAKVKLGFLKIDKAFSLLAAEDLATTSILVVARKP
ncbi:MAG: class I SAM-dependent methyltransferase [Candidatus Omnitrophica bacterium]|nr:class I SAM-dependent methyltransferase [Candidatus Omnitrophota bacterium]